MARWADLQFVGDRASVSSRQILCAAVRMMWRSLMICPVPPGSMLMRLFEKFLRMVTRSTIPSEDILHAKLRDVGNRLGGMLLYDDPAEGLFAWKIELLTPQDSTPATACISWFMKPGRNAIHLHDPVFWQAPKFNVTTQGELAAIASSLQEEFKRRWLEMVGPIQLREPRRSEQQLALQMKVMKDILYHQPLHRQSEGEQS
jgi:hypothetical protein